MWPLSVCSIELTAAPSRSATLRARRDLDLVRPYETGLAQRGAHHVAAELMLQHFHLMVEGLLQPGHQVGGADLLLHPVGATVEAALAPA